MLILSTVGLLGGGGVGFSASQAESAAWYFFDFTEYGGGSYYVSGLTANVVGGVAPYTFAWTQTVGSAGVNQPTSQFTDLVSDTGSPATFYCTVTDANGAVAITNECTVN